VNNERARAAEPGETKTSLAEDAAEQASHAIDSEEQTTYSSGPSLARAASEFIGRSCGGNTAFDVYGLMARCE
jgi:hypothetical protein